MLLLPPPPPLLVPSSGAGVESARLAGCRVLYCWVLLHYIPPLPPPPLLLGATGSFESAQGDPYCPLRSPRIFTTRRPRARFFENQRAGGEHSV